MIRSSQEAFGNPGGFSEDETLKNRLGALERITAKIRPADREAEREARQYIAALAMPPGSLGRLEDAAVRLAGITGKVCSAIEKKKILVLCADNGVVEEGVSCAPRSVTMQQAINMTRGKTGMSSMAQYFGDVVQVIDMGIAADYKCEKIVNRRIRKGTGDILREPAMTMAEVCKAVWTGIELVQEAAEEGVQVIGVGEMGIGNTTTSAAVLCTLTGLEPETVVGRGGGLTDEALAHKKEVVRRSLVRSGLWRGEREKNDVLKGAGEKRTLCEENGEPVSSSAFRVRNERIHRVTHVLAEVGGLDLAAMCGVYLGCARYRIPAVIDGYISAVAALCAVHMAADAGDYLFASHLSTEPGYRAAMEELGLSPWMDLGMHLGEGSGCPLAFEALSAACAFMNGMATFSQAGIHDGYLEEIRSCGRFQE